MSKYEISSDEDELPFACFICRETFKNPVVTKYVKKLQYNYSLVSHITTFSPKFTDIPTDIILY